MSKSYWVATYQTIGDLEKLKKYAEVVTPVIKSFGGQALVRGGKYKILEGENFIRTVIWEFPSYQKAMECYESKNIKKDGPWPKKVTREIY